MGRPQTSTPTPTLAQQPGIKPATAPDTKAKGPNAWRNIPFKLNNISCTDQKFVNFLQKKLLQEVMEFLAKRVPLTSMKD